MTGLQPPPSPPYLKIASRRSGIDRVFGTAVAVMVLVLVVGVGAITFIAVEAESRGLAFVAVTPTVVIALLFVWSIVRTWRRLRSITTPIELDHGGLVLHAPQGAVRCPWEAVTSIGFGRNALTRVLIVRLHPEAGPEVPGLGSTLPPRVWRVIRRSGFRYATWLLDIGEADLAAAIAHFSRGRVHLAPRG